MYYKELIELLRRTVEHGDEEPREYCSNRCGGCEMCDQAADAIENLLAERDAAVEKMRGECDECIYAETDAEEYPCNSCCYVSFIKSPDADHWQWSGLNS